MKKNKTMRDKERDESRGKRTQKIWREQVGEDDEAKRTRRGDKERLMCQRKERWKSEGREGGRIMTGE